MNDLSVKITKLKENAILPAYQTEHAAGMDLHACLDTPVTVRPMERINIPTGLSIELPPGYESQIRARSGLSIKYGMTMVNGVGTIDGDYRGEYGVLMINLGSEPFVIEPDMRVAQLVIAKYEHVAWDQVDSLSKTERGAGGFGSTGDVLNNKKD
ncbi:MAG: dUTP diphosphatase [Candidatus Saccharibacteria bacterium]